MTEFDGLDRTEIQSSTDNGKVDWKAVQRLVRLLPGQEGGAGGADRFLQIVNSMAESQPQ